MLYKIFLTSLLFLSYLNADKFDSIKEIEDKAFKEIKNIDLSSIKNNIEKNDFEKNLNEIYNKTLKNVEIETKRIKGENVELKNFSSDIGNKIISELNIDKFIANNRIYIFMSESIPMDIWYTYGKLIDNKKLVNTNLVLRGCIGGNCTKIAPTASFILKLKQYDNNKHINPNVIIDPLLFRKYNINRVPCVVFAENTQTKDLTQSEGNEDNFNYKNIYKSCGDWNLNWHLKEINKKAKNSDLEQIIDYLEPKGSL